jgi:L-fuconolactonase
VTIFDIHPHVIAPDRERYPHQNVFGHTETFFSERPVDAERMLAEMDEAGIAKAVLVQTFLIYGYDNSYAADSAAAHPDRFGSVGTVDARAADAPERLRYWIRERNMDGLRVFASFAKMTQNSDWIGDAAVDPLWETAAELDIPVCVTMQFYSCPVLAKVLARYPTLRIVLDHCGAPPAEDGPPFRGADPLWALAGAPNLYLKLTSSLIERLAKSGATEAFLRRTIDLFGADRIAWGSNYPTSEGPLSKLVAFAKSELAPFSEGERAAILGGTARSLYPTLLESDHIGTG